MTKMKSEDFVKRLRAVAACKTLYVMGCFGAPMNAANKKRYTDNCDYNKQPARRKMINAADADTFGFDCVNLIKGILWGWCGDKSKVYGGARYAVNGVPDTNADGMIAKCTALSTDFGRIVPGEAVWMKGHIGVYLGEGLAIECTPLWKNGVQITACNCSKQGYNRRNWTKHGKLPYVDYSASQQPQQPAKPTTTVQNFKSGDIVRIVGNTYYNGVTVPSWVKTKQWTVKSAQGDRVLVDKSADGTAAICSPFEASALSLVKPASSALAPAKSYTETAKEVIAGKWGNGAERRDRLTKAGYDYDKVQAEVNKLLK